MIKTYDKQMRVANCEYLIFSNTCEINTDQSMLVVDLNERRSNSSNLVWSIGIADSLSRVHQLLIRNVLLLNIKYIKKC